MVDTHSINPVSRNIMALPETFTSIKAKISPNVKVAIEAMNQALLDVCADPDVKPQAKLKVTQDYLALYMKLENEIMKEAEHREVMKHKRLQTKIKQTEAMDKEKESEEDGFSPIVQSRFSPSMNIN